jgi:hypothetical protein
MHRLHLQFGYSDRLQIYVKEVAEGHKFLVEIGNPSFKKAYVGCITV